MSKILIIEDEENLRDVYKEVFELEEFEVETAKDGQEGIEKIASFVPDIILLDLVMPRMSGFDVLKSVRANPAFKNIPIIILTNINPNVEDLLKNWGATHFILKIDKTPGEVVERVKEVLKND